MATSLGRLPGPRAARPPQMNTQAISLTDFSLLQKPLFGSPLPGSRGIERISTVRPTTDLRRAVDFAVLGKICRSPPDYTPQPRVCGDSSEILLGVARDAFPVQDSSGVYNKAFHNNVVINLSIIMFQKSLFPHRKNSQYLTSHHVIRSHDACSRCWLASTRSH